MIYGIIAILLFAVMLVYFQIADKFNIIDKPNQRSSHTQITIRGGGVIFPIAAILSGLFFNADLHIWILIAAILAISIVSFLDDISSLPNKVRIAVHLLSVTALLYATQAFAVLPWWSIVITYILIIGAINAYNFMDGINGITGVYSLVILLSCLYFNIKITEVINCSYIIIAVIACLVFLFFNFRKKAKCFAGDVGSVSIGLWIISILLFIIISTGELKYIFFLAVYGVDAVLTIMHRLILKQNIFEAHRLHFYQIMANERKMPHLLVSSIYGILQLLVNCFILLTTYNVIITGLFVCIPLVFIYIIAKPKMMSATS
ncbi:MAG: glycosyltransferase family 4 protein [Taibaiella sp.]|jgi:UDP-N-acetylmuramyl pentapeptide phosphotransferase/UDP-N-acetylglucosamine-1-phosphate transferase